MPERIIQNNEEKSSIMFVSELINHQNRQGDEQKITQLLGSEIADKVLCIPLAQNSGDKKGGRKLKGFGVLRVRDEDRLLGFMTSATGRDLTLGSHHQQSCGKRSVGIRDTGSVVSVSLVAEHQRKRKVDKLGNVDVYYASVE
ncbi:hypothetical protein GOBAR_AA10914 [Gossypium barbadense]|uniref:Uncharacterized protein n=1 Tax=Gossypium barbadense TaxID=3634 RepID=A0A2P5Y2F7_GOSBA|nr:hypothetical protein GOBAR_AA10914 [Gossypium barbadense]